jgi:hypothetical protein
LAVIILTEFISAFYLKRRLVLHDDFMADPMIQLAPTGDFIRRCLCQDCPDGTEFNITVD